MSKFVTAAPKRSVSSQGYAAVEMRPTPRAGHCMLVLEDGSGAPKYLFVVGGYAKNGPLADVFRFDIAASKWERVAAAGPPAKRPSSTAPRAKVAPSPLPRLEFDCCCMSSDIFLFGGIQMDEFDNVLIYNDMWSFDTIKMRWTVLDEGSLVSERSSHSFTTVASGLVVFGGECMSMALSDAWLWRERAWRRVGASGPQPEARSAHAACYIAESSILAVFGGITSVDGEVAHLNDLWCMDTGGAAEQWVWSNVVFQSGLAPSPRDLPMVIALRGGLLIMGGYGLEEKEDDEEVGGEEEPLSAQIDNISLDNREHMNYSDNNGDAEDAASVDSKADGEDEDEVELGYLCDAFFVDVAAASSRELPCGDEALSRGSSYGPARRGARAVLLAEEVLTFGGYDGEGFVGFAEVLHAGRLLAEAS